MKSTQNKQTSTGGSGSAEANSFARRELARPPLRRSEESGAGISARSYNVGSSIHFPAMLSVVGAWLMRAINQNSNISKDLKTALLRLRKSMDDAKQDHVRLVETAATAEPVKVKVTKSTQTEAFAFAGNPKDVADATAGNKHRQKRVGQSSGEELPGGARKARRILTQNVSSNANKSDPSQGRQLNVP